MLESSSPQLPLAPLLTLLLPGVWLAGRFLAARVTHDAALARLLSPALGGAAWVLAIHLVGRFSQSFVAGLWTGSLLVGGLGYASWRRTRRRSADVAGPRPSWRSMLLSAAAATAFIAPMALSFAFHDEKLLTGHMSITAQMENGHYPPRHMTFPEFELRYHYAFDVLAAVTSALFRLPVDRSLDAVTLASFFYSFCLLWLVGFRLVGPGRSAATPLVALFGAGITFAGMPAGETWVRRMLALGGVSGAPYNPPMLSYFFQHPWAAGLPWALAVVLLLSERGHRSAWRYAVLGLLLTALTIGQIVLALTVSGALLAAESWSHLRPDWRRAGRAVATLAAVLIAARACGGFALAPIDEGGALRLRGGVGVSPLVTLVWHLFNFGLLLPLGIVGIGRLRAGRVFFAILALGSIAVFNLVEYAHSWDILKFANVTNLALAIPASAAIAGLLDAKRRAVALGLAGFTLAGAIAGGVGFATVFLLGPEGIPDTFPRSLERPAGDDARAIGWLRGRIRPGEVSYRRVGASLPYGLWGGIPQPFFDMNVPAFGFSKSRLAARYRVLRALPERPEPYRLEGIRWLVLDRSDARLSSHADRWVAAGEAADVARFGELRIVDLGARGPVEDPR